MGLVCIGVWYVIEYYGVVFDLIISVKGIVGGMLFVVVIGCVEIMDFV